MHDPNDHALIDQIALELQGVTLLSPVLLYEM